MECGLRDLNDGGRLNAVSDKYGVSNSTPLKHQQSTNIYTIGVHRIVGSPTVLPLHTENLEQTLDTL